MSASQTQNEFDNLLKFLDENGIEYKVSGIKIMVKGKLVYTYSADDYTNYEIRHGKKTIFYSIREGFQLLIINWKRHKILYDSFAFYNYPYFIIVIKK